MNGFLNDLRHALRRLMVSPGFTLVAVLSLAIGIGANTALFSAVNALLLRPLPIAEPGRVVRYYGTVADKGGGTWSLSLPNLLDVERRARVFTNAAAWQSAGYTIAGKEQPERLDGARVQHDLFNVLGVQPIAGRGFLAEEDRPNSPDRVAVIGYDLWQRRFGGSRDALGQSVQLNGVTHTIVGVMPRGFQFPFHGEADLWTPLRQDESTWNRASGGLSAVARLAPDVTVESATRELDAVAKTLAMEFPQTNTGLGFGLVSMTEDVYGPEIRVGIYALFAAVAIVLLIACFNLASVLLARATDRESELAIRAAIGGGRGRIVTLFLLEGVLLSVAGGLLGLVVAVWGNRALAAAAPDDMVARSDQIAIDANVLLFAIGLSLLTGVLVGLAPIAQSAKPNLANLLRESGRHSSGGRARGRLRRLLVVTEVALAVVLLAGAGLLVRSFRALLAVDTGFVPQGVLTTTVSLDQSYDTSEKVAEFQRQLLERLRAIPSVTAAGGSAALPLAGTSNFDDFEIEGQTFDPTDKPNAGSSIITPGYFGALTIPLLRGRDFTASDTRDRPGVVVVSQGMVQTWFGGQDPIGRRVKFGWDNNPPYWRTVIGVVGDVRHGDLDEELRAEMYVPYAQLGRANRGLTLALRTSVDPRSITGPVQRAVRDVNPSLAVYDIYTMEERIRLRVAYASSLAWLFGVFAVVALGLTALGLYGLISYWVAQRTRELGIRAALGAAAPQIIRLVVSQGFALVASGLGIGIVAALLIGRAMRVILFGVSSIDPLTFAAVPLLLLVVTMVAAMLPALRASRIDPIEALKAE